MYGRTALEKELPYLANQYSNLIMFGTQIAKTGRTLIYITIIEPKYGTQTMRAEIDIKGDVYDIYMHKPSRLFDWLNRIGYNKETIQTRTALIKKELLMRTATII